MEPDGALPSWNGAYSYGEPSGVPRRLSSILAAPVAQLDRAPDYESGGQEFESLRARHGYVTHRQHRKNLIINRFGACRWYQSVGSDDEGNERRFEEPSRCVLRA
jgi:hypothetical protein